MFRYNVSILFFVIILLWMIKIVELYFNFSFFFLGIYPLKIEGLTGLFFAPLLHGSLDHLIANTFPLILLGMLLIFVFKRHLLIIVISLYFLPNIFVWFFGRTGAYHIGASTFIYGMASLVFFTGIFEKKSTWLVLSLIIVFLYGGLVWGLFPQKLTISFESHISGAVVGFILAYILKGKHDTTIESAKDITKYSTTFKGIDFNYSYKTKKED